MPIAQLNGIQLNYRVDGAGDLVVLIMGTGSPGRVWQLHQVPALVAAGYRVVTFDNRGIAPSSESLDGMTIANLVADTAALIEHVGGGPARVIGTSMGSRVAQELTLARPDLVVRAAFLAAHWRMDVVGQTLSEGEIELHDKGIELPAKYNAAITAMQNLSPTTLRDQRTAQDWLDIIEFSGSKMTPGVRAQLSLRDFPDRKAAYSRITVPCLAVGFAHDQLVPSYLAKEVADAIPGAQFAEIADCGHYGYLERPDEVNRVLLTFLAAG